MSEEVGNGGRKGLKIIRGYLLLVLQSVVAMPRLYRSIGYTIWGATQLKRISSFLLLYEKYVAVNTIHVLICKIAQLGCFYCPNINNNRDFKKFIFENYNVDIHRLKLSFEKGGN